MIRDSNRSKC